MVSDTEKTSESKSQVVEQRIKPTVIRRRPKKVEETPPLPEVVAPAETAVSATEAPQPTAAQEETPVVKDSSSEQVPQVQATQEGVPLAKPTGAQHKIGVVGYINLGETARAAVKTKEDWRERAKRGPRRRKSRAELEMEAIQRAGGLKQYAEVFTSESAPAGEKTPSTVEERVFQPVPSGRRKRVQRKEFKKTRVTEPKAIKKIIRMEEGISVSGLSQALGVKASEIIQKLMGLGVMATVNQQVEGDTAALIAGEYGYVVEKTAFKEEEVLVEPDAKVSVENLVLRPPVVTVMGHVDHGKTSILDVIRKTDVAAAEAGGITQHIGAYEVAHPKGTITFLDTPGHEAFTMMRARGAQATDVVVLVVAADDGVMPQTIEAIDHAKAANVPIIVAINKIDKPGAQPERVKKALADHSLLPEDWGGNTICVPTSAKTREGIEQLLEMILLQSEMLELKANPLIRPSGVVVEARLDKNKGPMTTVLVQEGTLKVGSYVVCGTHGGKVRAMFDAIGRPIDEAGPSKPVEILGLSGVPAAGDQMVGVSDEHGARMVAEQRRIKERERQLLRPVHASLEDLSKRLEEGEAKELQVIIKADVRGSIEAISETLVKLSTERVRLSVLHTGVGEITESDIMLASASDAVVLGFGVTADPNAREAAGREGVEIRTYRIIYEMIDEVKKAMEGLLAPEEKEIWLGRAEVRQVFKISKVGTIAGCMVTSGKIQRNAHIRLLRDNVIAYEGKISSLKRVKEDAREVTEGLECGIGIENFGDIKEGDIIEAFIIERKAATL